MSTTELLQSRQTTHGSFTDNARYSQGLKEFYRLAPAFAAMPDVQREALEMIACKISRILSGQSNFVDHWSDLAGYAELAKKACE